MLYKNILLLLLSISICLASEETGSKPEILLTKEQLIDIIKKIEKDPKLRERYLPSSRYLPSLKTKTFSEVAPDELYEKIVKCIKNNKKDCFQTDLILYVDYWKQPENEIFLKENEELFKHYADEAIEYFKGYQREKFREKMTQFYSFIQGYMLSISGSEQKKPGVSLTKKRLMDIVKKIEKDPNLSKKFFPSSQYLPSLKTKKLSEIAPDKWYEQIIKCINNNDEYCRSSAKILQSDYWNKPESTTFWKEHTKGYEDPKIRVKDEKKYQEFLSRVKKDFQGKQYENFLYQIIKFYSFIQGWVFGKKSKRLNP